MLWKAKRHNAFANDCERILRELLDSCSD